MSNFYDVVINQNIHIDAILLIVAGDLFLMNFAPKNSAFYSPITPT